jgi:hypothetical protein
MLVNAGAAVWEASDLVRQSIDIPELRRRGVGVQQVINT